MKTINRLNSLRALATLVLSVFALSSAFALPPDGGGPDPDGPTPPPPSGPADLIVSSVFRIGPNYMQVSIKNQGYTTSPATTVSIATYCIRPYVVLGANEYYVPSLGAGKYCTLYISTNYNLFAYGSRIDFDPNPHFKVTESDYLNNWYVIFNNGYPTGY